MAKRKKIDLVTCPYCRKQLRHCDSERDHIPPKGLFPAPRPSNLLTIRCCPECHDSLSQGDEPLKAMGGLGVFRNNDAHQLVDGVFRGLERNPWWKKPLVDAAQKGKSVDLIVDSEIVRFPKIEISGEVAAAINTSLKRTVVGLLHDWDPTRVVSLENVEIIQVPEENPEILRSIFGEMPLRFQKLLGKSFRAIWDFANDSPENGAMVLSFFDGLHFVAFINVDARMIRSTDASIIASPQIPSAPQ